MDSGAPPGTFIVWLFHPHLRSGWQEHLHILGPHLVREAVGRGLQVPQPILRPGFKGLPGRTAPERPQNPLKPATDLRVGR